MGSFLKDLFLLVLIGIIFIYRKEIHTRISNNSSWLILGLTLVLSFALQWYVMRYLPVIDCLPFKKGANIPEKMKPPKDAVPDSTVISFVYEKNHQTLEFTASNLPADLDSSYAFIKRYDKLIRKGNAEPEIKDFSFIAASGNDSTMEVLDRPGYQLMVISRNFPESDPSWNKSFVLLYTLAKSKNIPVFVVTSNQEEANRWLLANELITAIPVFGCDATAVKTAARADPTLYLLKKGTILDKWSYAHFNLALHQLAELPFQEVKQPVLSLKPLSSSHTAQ